ncbi:MAG TPA: DNA alkylation repair protein [Verrucomicrobiae bacterium]|nr:DNA alkylation repair protein [Verrucomicrobiae bacterium]
MLKASQVIKELKLKADPKKGLFLMRFFKTGKGEYAEGDIFIGITVPQQRLIAKKYLSLPLNENQKLISSKIHEYRLTALIILTHQYKRATINDRRKIFSYYMKNRRFVNNWDLVDTSAPYISGPELYDKPKKLLYKLIRSKSLWDKRIGILSTLYFIRQGEFADILKITKLLISDKHDLIQKALGWMLREIGKKNLAPLIDFLEKHHKIMPRTMLRYSIERLPLKLRAKYLAK